MKACEEYVRRGKLGDLIFDPESPVSVQLYPQIVGKDGDGYKMFDNKVMEWVKYDKSIVPWTYSDAPKPTNVLLELDYFLRSAPLVKHKYIWVDHSDEGINRNIFEMVNSNTNHEFFGRFSVAPFMPPISTIATMTPYGFIEQNQSEFERFKF